METMSLSFVQCTATGKDQSQHDTMYVNTVAGSGEIVNISTTNWAKKYRYQIGDYYAVAMSVDVAHPDIMFGSWESIEAAWAQTIRSKLIEEKWAKESIDGTLWWSPLTHYRHAAGLTQQQLADASGVNVRQIRKVESGEIEIGNMSSKNVFALANALNIDPHKLL